MTGSTPKGNAGGTWILANATTTPASGKRWCRLTVMTAMEVTAIVGVSTDGTHGTHIWAGATVIEGIFTSITCSNTNATGLIWGEYDRY